MASLRAYFGNLKALMVGDPLPPERVAAGWALGMFIGCTIPFGFQLIVSVPLSFLFRVSKIGASVGTLITNPVTIFFIYPAQTYAVYNLLFGSRAMERLPSEWTWESVMALSGPVIVSFFLGGLLLGFVLTPITYFIVRRIVILNRRIVESSNRTIEQSKNESSIRRFVDSSNEVKTIEQSNNRKMNLRFVDSSIRRMR